ncbi:hypothetical protein DES36_11765 [Alkalibaculum bacchi]|uniref:Uncharacterized protein n=1 Tax=Alkalibaculum bacchi TaxID=645887 RepID=A0A366HZV2_9FIRM|nr:hypothetical protein [Alkalibaculum bacchi]RBP59970.1 hypothetical protein DES36_11765 [Alkalibaculum bacchi]
MEEKYQEIKDLILDGLNPEKIYLLDMGPILLLAIVWDSAKNDFDKRIQIRKLLRNINIPFDIVVVSTDELEELNNKGTSFTCNIIKNGILLYDKTNCQ